MPGHSYKGARSSPESLSLWAAPLASPGPAETVNITPNSGNPYAWQLWESLDGGLSYILADSEPGDVHVLNGISDGDGAYVRGVQSDGSPQTGDSNSVIIQP